MFSTRYGKQAYVVSDGTITIIFPRWRKYQRKLKGNSRHRNWFAVNANIGRDPDFMALKMQERYAWIMLLSEASLRGVEQESDECLLKVCPKLFRSLYGLRRDFDFQCFVNQGFIQIREPTEQDRTGQNIPVGTAAPSDPPEESFSPPAKPPPEIPPPSTETGHPSDPTAETIWRTGLALMVQSGISEGKARNMLGKLVKRQTDAGVPKQRAKEALAAAIGSALVNRPVQPFEYIAAALADRPENKSNFDKNVAVLSDWLGEQNARTG